MSSNLKKLGDQIEVKIPKDDDGYLGRECPEETCLGYFKIKPGTGLSGEDLPCICPYCGFKGNHNQFWTQEQIKYARSFAMREITSAVRKDLKALEFNIKPQGSFGIGMSVKLKSEPQKPLYYYREKQLETNLVCENCTLNYSVYGVFGFCPDCNIHNSIQILTKNLKLIRKQIDLSNNIDDDELSKYLIEDALVNCVSTFDGFGRETCKIRSTFSTDAIQAERISFQNLEKAQKKVKSLFNIDFPTNINDSEWDICQLAFKKRHLIAHRSGVVDQQYLDETGDNQSILGRKISINPNKINELTYLIEKIGRNLIAVLPNL